MTFYTQDNEYNEIRYKLCNCGATLSINVLMCIEWDGTNARGIDSKENVQLVPAFYYAYWKRKVECINGVASVRCLKCNRIHRVHTFKA
jgi:hypothetical protein